MQVPPLFVGIVGGSGSGKTWLAKQLEAALRGRAVRVSLDCFYRDRSYLSPARRARVNFDRPGSIDWSELMRVLSNCYHWRRSRIPVYDFKTHSRRPNARWFTPKPVIILEGLWVLRKNFIRPYLNFSIFLDCPVRLRLNRRLQRDLAARGRTRQSIAEQFRRTVEPMHQQYVLPQRSRAGMIFRGTIGRREVAKLAAAIEEELARRKCPGPSSPRANTLPLTPAIRRAK